MAELSKLWLFQQSNESVFILIEEFYITEVSFRYSPGKHMSQVFFLLNQKAQSPLLKTSQPFALVYFRFVGMYVYAQRLLLSVCRKKTLSSNNILQL